MTFDIPSYLMGKASGGGVELVSLEKWNSFTTEQKLSKGLVAIQSSDVGYERGLLVNGADYKVFNVVQSGTASSSKTFSASVSGAYKLYVIALNSEASTYQLDVSATQNGAALTQTLIEYHQYYSSGTNRRNYRFLYFDVNVVEGDTIQITLSNKTYYYSSFVYALVESNYSQLSKSLSTADQVCSGSNIVGGIAVYGTFDSNQGGTINSKIYTENTTVTTQNPGINYKSAYIFWLI